MRKKVKKYVASGLIYAVLFIVWTVVIQTVDVKPLGVNGTQIGLSAVNVQFHTLTDVNMSLYYITDWMGLVPVGIGVLLGLTGFVQLVKRKSIVRVDKDIIITGGYYAAVILCYLIFEELAVNYRPILIDGVAEASYPSSTTLLVLCVMPAFSFFICHRINNANIKRTVRALDMLFSAFTVYGRVLSGVHWLSDIIGAMLFSAGLYNLYKAAILMSEIKSERR